MNISIVIPLHNEEKHIGEVLNEVSKYKLPIVVVNDGSYDNSKVKIQKSKIQFKIQNLTVLEHKINLGKGAAMKTGAEFAFQNGADAVIFMDSDGQHKASDLPKFVTALNSKKYDIVYGTRNLSMGVPLVRYLGNKIASLITARLFGGYVSDSICGFRGLTKKGYQKIKWDSVGYGVEIEMVARAGKRKITHTEVPVETVYLDGVKGVTLLDAFGILGEVVKWRLTLK
jgi:glycosyltransferase involved in cell wall biosynthesis